MASLLEKGREVLQMTEEIQIPKEYMERIDKILVTENSQFHSREQFIKSAIKMKLTELISQEK